MIYGSVCSGIEAASVAWHSIGWRAAFLSEIDAFPRAILQHHYMETPLHGDFTTIRAGEYEPIDLLVGGTPCQSFSVAGLRGGLDDDRGNLALEYLKLADRLRPRWVVWENVPGVLSSNGGRDFGSILGGLVELGYGFAYRVLDAQFFGVPQRRRRVFVVGYLGDWRPAAAVLFERQSLRGDSPPSREAGKGVAGRAAFGISPDCLDRSGEASTGTAGDRSGLGVETETAYALRAKRPGAVATMIAPELARCVATREGSLQDYETTTMIAHSLRADGFDASEDGTGRGTPIVPVAFDLRGREGGAMPGGPHDTANLRAASGGSSRSYVAFAQNQREEVRELNAASALSAIRRGDAKNETLLAFSNTAGDTTLGMSKPGVPPLTSRHGDPGNVLNGNAVRRLTPRECERLQGFPDSWTLVPYRGKPAADGPRYKALGNSMAVPVMRWIGERIQLVENLLNRS